MTVTVCKTLSDHSVTESVQPGTLSDIFTSLGLGNAVALVNGKIAVPETVVSDEDVVFIRQVPKGIVTGLIIAAGVLLVAGAAYAGYEVYKMRKQMERYKEGLSSFGDSVTNLPNVKGANNVRALDRSIPYIIGKTRIAPYVLSEGVISIGGQHGLMYRQVPYILGYGYLVLRKCFSNGRDVYTFTGDTPQQGRFSVPDISRGTLVIAQTGVQYTAYPSFMRNTYVTIDAGDQLLKADDPNYTALTYTLPENTAEAQVFLMFNGLRKYSSDGKDLVHSITLRLTYSIDGGTTWHPLTSIGVKTGDYVVSYNRATQFRTRQSLTLPFATTSSLTEPIQIRIECISNMTSGALEDVFVQSIRALTYDPQASIDRNNYSFLPVIDEDVAKKCCIVGLHAGARNSEDEDAFRNLAFIVEGMAWTWNGSTWGNRAPTRNPASWLFEILTSDVHKQSEIEYSEIDYDSFGELYEYCEEEEIEVSMVILEGEPKEKIIQKLCDICYSTLYKNLDGKIAVATDKPKENAIAIINTQNCFSFTNKKDLTPQVDGLRITFINEDTDYEQDAYEVMRPGVTKDANSKIRALTVDGITKYDQIVKYAWRLMAIESARPKVSTVEIGNEGVYYTPLSKVLVQHPSLKNGLGSAEIKAVVMSGTDMIGLDLYEPIAYDSGEASGFGVVIQCVTDSYSSILAKAYTAESDGLVSTITFTVPIDTTTASVIPHAGDNLSYGLLDAGEFNTITNEMMITNMSQTERGYRLDLVDYNEAIYEYGEIPVYEPNITQTRITKYVPTSVPAASLPDVVDAVTEAEKPITISGVPVFADRETCLAECTLNEVHYLLYQDTADWEIVTINEDLTTTSFLTGAGVLNDMCAYDGKIFVSDDDGLYYVDTGALVQVYDSGLGSIQSDGENLYAIKDGQFCRFEYDITQTSTIAANVVFPLETAFIGEEAYFLGAIDKCVYRIESGAAVKKDFTYDEDNNQLFEHDGELCLYRYEDGVYQIDFTLETVTKIYNAPVGALFDDYKLVSLNGDIYTVVLSGAEKIVIKLTNSAYPYYEIVARYFVDSTTESHRGIYKVNGELFAIEAKYADPRRITLTQIVLGIPETMQSPSGEIVLPKYFAEVHCYKGEIYLSLSSTPSGAPEYTYALIDKTNAFVKECFTEGGRGNGAYTDGEATIYYTYDGGTYVIRRTYQYGAPIVLDETVRNYGKIRLAGSTIFTAVTDGHIYRLEDDGLVQHTQSPDGYNVASYRSGKFYCARDYAVFELKPDGTVLAIENAVSETPIVELFDYGDYLVWSPTYTSPETGTMYAAFVNFPGNVNVSQNITLSIPAEFAIGATKTFRRLKSYDGEPLILVPPSGAMFEGLNLAELYGKYSYAILERVSADLFTIVELKDEYKYSDEIRVVRTKSTVEYYINDAVTIPAGYSYFDYTVPERFNPARCLTTITASDPTAHWTFTVLGASLKAVSTYDNIRVSIQNDGASQDVTINVHCIVYSANVVYNTLVLENGDVVITDRGDSIAMAVLNED